MFRTLLKNAKEILPPVLSSFAGANAVVVLCEEKNQNEKKPEEKKPAPKLDFVGVFLDAESNSIFHARFPSTNQNDPKHITLKFNPTTEQIDQFFQEKMGETVVVKAYAVAQDESAETVLVSMEDTEGKPVMVENSHPHITIATSGTEGFGNAYSNVLLERFEKMEKLSKGAQENAASPRQVSDWSGELPEHKSEIFPYYNVYPKTTSEIRQLDEPLLLKGTICTKSRFDPVSCECLEEEDEETQCGFCIFMRAGPCGKQFRAWERCLDKCKKNGTDFIDHCGQPTLMLKECVDLHPEYYSVLQDDEAGNDKSSGIEGDSSEEPQSVDDKQV